MNFSGIFNDLAGQAKGGGGLSSITNSIPGGMVGGVVAGGLVASLLGSKSVRKTAITAAKYGGTALLGGMAYKAYQNWQQNKAAPAGQAVGGRPAQELKGFEQEALAHSQGTVPTQRFQLALIKAMIAAARSDGGIDSTEQSRISKAIDNLGVSGAAKQEILELFIRPIEINDIVSDLDSMEQKAEVYLASCMAIELDHEGEYNFLSQLSKALQLPPGLEQELRSQAKNAALN